MIVKDPTFKHLSNAQLVARINRAKDFSRDDEEAEIIKRMNNSNGKFKAEMDYDKLVIIKDD